MSKLEDTAYNYGAKIKGRAMSNLEHPRITEVGRLLAERDQWREAHDRVDHRAFALAQERDRLREALEPLGLEAIVAGWQRDPEAPRHPPRLGVTLKTDCGTVYAIVDALAKEAGK